jgi:hypothetical protein
MKQFISVLISLNFFSKSLEVTSGPTYSLLIVIPDCSVSSFLVDKFFPESYNAILFNWDRKISSDHLPKVEQIVKEHDNVKLFYIDVSSDPKKTNIKEI